MLRSLLLMMAMLGLAAAAPVRAAGPGHYLFSGDQAAKGKDFLAVIDGGSASPGYGRLLISVATDQISVRSHHTEYEMPASGMLFANDHDANRSFIFDLRDPVHSRVETSFTDLAGFAMPHRFLRLPNGHVLASFQQARSGVAIAGMPEMMGHAKSDGLVEIDDAGKFVRAVANADPAHPGMLALPYSLTVLPAIDRVLVTNSPMQDDYLLQSVTYQLFRLSDLKLFGTWPLDPGPSLSGHIGPEEARLGPDGAVYVQTLSCGLQRVNGMDTAKPAAVLVHQFPGFSCGVPTIAGIIWCSRSRASAASSGEDKVTERFVGAGVERERISFQRDTFLFDFDGPPAEAVDRFRHYYGPTMNAFDAAAKDGREEALHAELVALFTRQNEGDAGRTHIPATFLRVTVKKG